MARATLELCDLCLVPLSGQYPGKGSRHVKAKNGLVVTVGYSEGGWGRRRNAIDFSGEVCLTCYDAVMKQAWEMEITLTGLRSKEEHSGQNTQATKAEVAES